MGSSVLFLNDQAKGGWELVTYDREKPVFKRPVSGAPEFEHKVGSFVLPLNDQTKGGWELAAYDRDKPVFKRLK